MADNPLSENPDDHPGVVAATVKFITGENVKALQRLADQARTLPGLNAETALRDAADMLARAGAQFIAKTRQ